MIRRTTTPLALVLLLAACAGGASSAGVVSAAPAPAGTTAPPSVLGALERTMHHLVNEHRVSQSLAPLRWDDRLGEIAREHSRAMASGRRSFSHDGFDDRAARVQAILPVRSMAENVAYDSRSGPELPRYVVQGWIDSPGHRRNIEGAATVTGIGAAERSDGMRYFTQIFVQAAGQEE